MKNGASLLRRGAPEEAHGVTMLTAAQRRQVRTLLAEHLRAPVQVLFFSAAAHDPAAAPLRELMADLVSLSDGKIQAMGRTGREGQAEAARFGVDQAPALALLDGGGNDTGVRFYGVPLGYELMVLLEDLIDLSRGETRLPPAARALVRAVDRELVIRVYSTPT